MDDTLIWTLVIVGVVVIAALLAAWVVSRRLQRRRLEQRFGPEYERTIERTGGDRKQAEAALGDRLSRREELELKPLSPAARDNYLRRWEQVQAEFVDQPEAALQHAQSLLDGVMVERGYPTGDEFEERADLISVDHPEVVDHYRFAHRLHRGTSEADATAGSTEARRQALVHYRALFTELLHTAEVDWGAAPDVPNDAEIDRERGVR
jgi:hypothetical protein